MTEKCYYCGKLRKMASGMSHKKNFTYHVGGNCDTCIELRTHPLICFQCLRAMLDSIMLPEIKYGGNSDDDS